MLSQRGDEWETGEMVAPFGRGVMFQIEVTALQPILDALNNANWPLYAPLREVWRRAGDCETGQREFFVLDPDGYTKASKF